MEDHNLVLILAPITLAALGCRFYGVHIIADTLAVVGINIYLGEVAGRLIVRCLK